MHQVKENVENSVQTKKICTLVQVCREIWKGSKVCRRRKKFENHWSSSSSFMRIVVIKVKKLSQILLRNPKEPVELGNQITSAEVKLCILFYLFWLKK